MDGLDDGVGANRVETGRRDRRRARADGNAPSAFVADFQKCYAGADVPQECTLQKEDYLECLHHYKEVRAACCVAPRLDWLASTARGSIPSADALFCPFLRPTTYDLNPLETRPPLDMNIVLRRLRPHPTPPAPRRTRIALAPRAGLASTDDQGAIPIQDGARAQGEADRSRGAGRVGDHVARPIKGGRQEGVAPELAEPGMERVWDGPYRRAVRERHGSTRRVQLECMQCGAPSRFAQLAVSAVYVHRSGPRGRR